MLHLSVIQLLASLTFLAQLALSIGQRQVISFESTSDTFPLVTSSQATVLLVSSDDYVGVHRASSTFASDLFKVTGQTPQLIKDDFSLEANTSEYSRAVIIGSLEQSSLIKMLIDNGKVNVSDIDGIWEAFKMVIVDSPMDAVDQALVIVGNDKRGTIFGLYDLSEQMGVSSWNWWADVATPSQEEVYFSSSDGYGHGEPSVKYRGFFLNDDQPALTNWAKIYYGNNDTAVFKHEFYESVYELILRLKGNMFWPAMWSAMFALDDPLNQLLADEYGVIYGTSHQEPMARNTPEWTNFGKGDWNYTSNKDFLDNFWTEGVERSKNYETLYTVGMRGNGDLPLPGANIPLVENIVANQQRILTNVTGKSSQEIPQVWCLFKEVQSYWEQGLQAPEEITLLWTDDNFGNVRRLPTDDEKKRLGGSGLYYHFDMVIDDPRNYKWINTNSIPKIWEQLHLTISHGANRLWIVNVGDLKPMELPMSFWFDYSYDTTRWNKDNLNEYVELWATREFGKDVAAATASVVSRYTLYVSRQKPELTEPDTYSLTDYREAERVIEEWKNVTDDAWEIYNGLPDEKRSSFFQLVLHPCRAIYTVTLLNIRAGENYLRATQAHMSTNTKAQDVLNLFREDAAITREYHSVSNGKWDHMMDQTHLGSYYWQ
ncbi:hypothetical protein [Phaffia rhodozyma]|uniref:Gylcosyl hydrolase 115 C-terminal domain-containing protein n=1 Tax=Phaffia rhodozyma TaxID=264483 RepID=A0A0F7SLI4_PHARH|nr:hypothetical protein [Phaffia rhodozyma]